MGLDGEYGLAVGGVGWGGVGSLQVLCARFQTQQLDWLIGWGLGRPGKVLGLVIKNLES